jgi:hypothetical protein
MNKAKRTQRAKDKKKQKHKSAHANAKKNRPPYLAEMLAISMLLEEGKSRWK